METWEKVKKILSELSSWAVGLAIFYTYGYEIGSFIGDVGRKLEKYYKWLLIVAGLDFIWVFVGILLGWSTFIGAGFVVAVVVFFLSWTPVAMAFVGVDKATKGMLGKYKLFPPIFGTIVFWICGAGLLATMYPKIVSMNFFVISFLVAVALLALWHSLGLKTHFQEWAMLVFIILMVVVYATQKTFPRFYEELENRITSWGYKAHDQVRTPVSTKFDSKLFDAKDKVSQMEINAINAELDKVINSMDATKVDSSYLNPNKPQEKLKEIARLEARRDELIKKRAETKLSPTSGSTTTSGSSGSGVLSSPSRVAKTAGNFPRVAATVMAVVLALLIVGGTLFKKLTYSEMAGYLFIIGVAFLIAWNYFEPKHPKLTLREEKGCNQLIVRGDRFVNGEFIVPLRVEGGDAYWEDGHQVIAGTGRPVTGGWPLRFCVTNPDMFITYYVMK